MSSKTANAIVATAIGLSLVAMIAITHRSSIPDTKRDVEVATPRDVPNTGNAAHDQLLSLEPNMQAVALGQTVNEGCVGRDAFYMGMDPKLNAYWSVRCANGKKYQVRISSDAGGSTTIMDCNLLKAVGKISCFEKLADQ
jgi:hypothetical protein